MGKALEEEKKDKYLKEREKIDQSYRLYQQEPPTGRISAALHRFGTRRSTAWQYRLYAARHLASFFRRSVAAVAARYNPRRLARLDAMAARYDNVRLSDLSL